MTALGIDYGEKRIGLAITDELEIIASPLATIPNDSNTLSELQRIVTERKADTVVVGLPLNMDGTEGPQVKLSKTLAAAIGKLSGLPVHLHDERLTSHAADARLVGRDLTRKKKKARQDAVAAQVLLESFLDRLSREP